MHNCFGDTYDFVWACVTSQLYNCFWLPCQMTENDSLHPQLAMVSDREAWSGP